MGAPDLTFGLDDAQLERYARHLILPEVGGRGQRALCDATVHLAGRDAAAVEALSFLVAAGVGRVEVSAEVPEAVVAHVRALNPEVAVTPVSTSARPARLAEGPHADGALAALDALLDLVGRPPAPWRVDPGIPGLAASPALPAPQAPHQGSPR